MGKEECTPGHGTVSDRRERKAALLKVLINNEEDPHVIARGKKKGLVLEGKEAPPSTDEGDSLLQKGKKLSMVRRGKGNAQVRKLQRREAKKGRSSLRSPVLLKKEPVFPGGKASDDGGSPNGGTFPKEQGIFRAAEIKVKKKERALTSLKKEERFSTTKKKLSFDPRVEKTTTHQGEKKTKVKKKKHVTKTVKKEAGRSRPVQQKRNLLFKQRRVRTGGTRNRLKRASTAERKE